MEIDFKMYGYGYTIDITDVSASFAGYGHKKIRVTVLYKGIENTITATTSDMHSYGAATDLEDYEDRQMALYNMVAHKIEEQLFEWLRDTDLEEEEEE